MNDRLAIPVFQIGNRARRHRARASDFRLTASLGSGNARTARDHFPDSCRDKESLHQTILRRIPVRLIRQQHCRDHSAGACGRSRNDTLHAGIGLAHLDRLFHDIHHEIPCKCLSRLTVCLKLSTIPAGQAACRAKCWIIICICLPHRAKHLSHIRKGPLERDIALFHVVLDHRLPECLILPCRLLHNIL